MRNQKEPAFLSDRQTFKLLYEQTHLIAYRYIYSLHGGPREDVEDLTAETFSRAWKARHRFEGSREAAIGWLLKIARRLVIDACRRRQVRGFVNDINALVLSAPGATPEEEAIRNDQLAILVDLLTAFPIEQREMLILRYILGWRVKDIGQHLDMPENTVSVTLRRLLQKLRDRWPGE
jgi:RNA polymerase sigma-70 factor (ECF subfamily)